MLFGPGALFSSLRRWLCVLMLYPKVRKSFEQIGRSVALGYV